MIYMEERERESLAGKSSLAALLYLISTCKTLDEESQHGYSAMEKRLNESEE